MAFILRSPSRPEIEPELLAHLKRQGYRDMRVTPHGHILALCDMAQTTDLFVGLTTRGYTCRYCYPRERDPKKDWAQFVVERWDGLGHPPGPWLKRKGLDPELVGPGAKEGP